MGIFGSGRGDPIPPKEEIVLQLLRDGLEMFGLQMVEASEGELKRGTVYVVLSRLEEKGFVSSRHEDRQPGAIGLPRRLYKITAHGADVLRRQERARAIFAEPVLS